MIKKRENAFENGNRRWQSLKEKQMTNTWKTVNITGQQENSNQVTVKHYTVTGTGVIGMTGMAKTTEKSVSTRSWQEYETRSFCGKQSVPSNNHIKFPCDPATALLGIHQEKGKLVPTQKLVQESEQVHRPYSSLKSSHIKRHRYTKCAIHTYSGISLGYTKNIYACFNTDEAWKHCATSKKSISKDPHAT